MTKRAVVIGLGLASAAVLAAVLFAPVRPPYSIGYALMVSMIFWGLVSGTVNAALTPGRWSERIDRHGARQRRFPRWVWLTLFSILVVANYLIALAILLGRLPFSPSRQA